MMKINETNWNVLRGFLGCLEERVCDKVDWSSVSRFRREQYQNNTDVSVSSFAYNTYW